MSISNWMSWEGGVDLVAATAQGLEQPNIIVHVARLVHTPVGSAPGGMIFLQTDLAAPPQMVGFVCPDPRIGAFFGPNIFAGTPFENVPVIDAIIEIATDLPGEVSARVTAANFVIETRLWGLGETEIVNRPVGALPFIQQGLEAPAQHAALRVNGIDILIQVPPQGMTGGPAAVWAPCGLYAR